MKDFKPKKSRKIELLVDFEDKKKGLIIETSEHYADYLIKKKIAKLSKKINKVVNP